MDNLLKKKKLVLMLKKVNKIFLKACINVKKVNKIF